MERILFCHGNGFPSGTYAEVFRSLARRGFEVEAIDRVGHRPDLPVTSNWPHLVTEWREFIEHDLQTHGKPVWLLGHSLGGMLSAMVVGMLGTRATSLAGVGIRGAIMLDTPLVSGWRSRLVWGAKKAGIVGRISPGAVSQKRRNTWPSRQAVRDHFLAKPVFAAWHPQALEDYLDAGFEPCAEGLCLRFDRDVETAIYNGLPHHLDAYFRAHRPEVPLALVAALDSREIRQGGLALNQRLTRGRIMRVEGSHLYPMEQPEMTAAAVEATILSLASANKTRARP